MTPYIPKFKKGDHIQVVTRGTDMHRTIFTDGIILSYTVAAINEYYYISWTNSGYIENMHVARGIDDSCVLYDSPEGVWSRL